MYIFGTVCFADKREQMVELLVELMEKHDHTQRLFDRIVIASE